MNEHKKLTDIAATVVEISNRANQRWTQRKLRPRYQPIFRVYPLGKYIGSRVAGVYRNRTGKITW
jgi:hypothetical protein